MTRILFSLAFLLGAAAVAWVGMGFRDSDLLALTVTAIIGAVYGLGFVELTGFRRATARLCDKLATLPGEQDALNDWISGLPSPLQAAIRRRIAGEPVALPGPMLAPYLLGLLVMLGLLGTFVGMIVTLNGAASALEGSSELSAIRSALAAPIAGLSLAFGTSIAGVAASAMLGLAATVSRRERIMVSRQLDQKIRQDLHHLSLNHQREQAFSALQAQSRALPELATAMQSMTTRMEQMSEQLAGTLTRNQHDFHDTVSSHYQTLAGSVAETLKASLSDSSRLAAESIRPIVEQAMAQLGEQAGQTQQQLSDITERQLGTLAERFQDTTEQAAVHWRSGLAEQQQSHAEFAGEIRRSLQALNEQFQHNVSELLTQANTHQQQLSEHTATQLTAVTDGFRQSTELAASSWQTGLAEHQQASADLVRDISESLRTHNEDFQRTTTTLVSQQQTGLDALLAGLGEQLDTLRAQEAERGAAATQRLGDLEATVTEHLGRLGTALEGPMTRLIETASETPKAAADVIAQLRQELSKNTVRDNELLDERRRIMTELDALLSAQQSAATIQRDAIETLIQSTSQTLNDVTQAFTGQVSEQSSHLQAVAGEVSGSAHEVASLSDAFSLAVELFSQSNDKLVDGLQGIESSLEAAAVRSDEQLAYYVEQAREVIELSVSSQQDVIQALAELSGKRSGQPAAEVS